MTGFGAGEGSVGAGGARPLGRIKIKNKRQKNYKKKKLKTKD